MARDSFNQKLAKMSNQSLYLTARRLFFDEFSGARRNDRRIDVIYDECEKRSMKIFSDALHDAFFMKCSLEDDMNGLNIVKIFRIDHLGEDVLMMLVQSLGAAKKQPALDYHSPEAVRITDLIGIKRENLLICTVSGASMKNAGIDEETVLLADKKAEPVPGDVVVVSLNGDLLVKRFEIIDGKVWLISENEDFPPFKVGNDDDFNIVAVVRSHINVTANSRINSYNEKS